VPIEIVGSEAFPADRLGAYIDRAWRADFVVVHGERIRPIDLPGFVALKGDQIVGHAAYRVAGERCELVALVVEPRRQGIGSLLLERVVQAARLEGAASLWLTTTNDNLDALRFYQRRGFRLVALRPGVVIEARGTLKPDLPSTGSYWIEMCDELDLELALQA
jgi:ribosomal protein S18 acetylase RimI-like enzyme